MPTTSKITPTVKHTIPIGVSNCFANKPIIPPPIPLPIQERYFFIICSLEIMKFGFFMALMLFPTLEDNRYNHR